MKKLFIILILMLFSFSQAQFNYKKYCAQIPPDKSFHGAIMSVTGLNLLSEILIEHQIERALKNETGSKFKVHTLKITVTMVFMLRI